MLLAFPPDKVLSGDYWPNVVIVQAGADRFALIAFQLFTLPSEFTLNALFALPLFAERKRTFRPNSLQPFISKRLIAL